MMIAKGEPVTSTMTAEPTHAAVQQKVSAELTLRGLRVFVAVEETGPIGGAAERIAGSPSGGSQQITALEQAVGAKLFDRRARPITLTAGRPGVACPCPSHSEGRL